MNDASFFKKGSHSFFPKPYYFLKRKYYSFLAKHKNISYTARLLPRENIFIQESTEIQDYVIIRAPEGSVTIGKFTQINPFTVIYGGIGIEIGNDVMIAPHCMIVSGNHNYKDLSQPMRHSGYIYKGPKIVIEDDVWIGAHSTVLDGVRIGRGAVIAANSVVKSDVPEYKIYAGNPAREIGDRKNLRSN